MGHLRSLMVLENTMRNAALKAGVLAFVIAGLAACTNGQFNSNPVFDYGLKLAGLGKKPEAAEVAPSVGPPLIVGYKEIRVAIPGVGPRGRSDYFVAPDGVEIAMNGIFPVRVIGLGLDLEGMYLPADSPYVGDFVAAARANASSQRVFEYWRKGRISRESLRCDLSLQTLANGKNIINERCKKFFDDLGFSNRYWLDENDEIICSRQWFHPDADVLQFFKTSQQALSIDLRKDDC